MRADTLPPKAIMALGALAAGLALAACNAPRPTAPTSTSIPTGTGTGAPVTTSTSTPPTTTPPPAASFAGCVSTGAHQSSFACMPAGKLLNGLTTWTGSTDATLWIPGMRFPLQNGPAYLNSQVYRYKGGYDANWLGPTGIALGAQNHPQGIEQCDTRNYSFPWQDTFCEQRPGSTQTNQSCPGNSGHQGVDIRGQVCRLDDPANQVVAVVDGTIVNVEPHYVKLMAEDETVYFNFMHMHFASRTHTKAQLAANPGGIPVARGTTLGRIGNIQLGTDAGVTITPTTRHLHFEIRMPVVNPATGSLENVPLPPYATLVDAYQRLLTGTP